MARKKHRKKKWPVILITLAFLGVLLPLTFWVGINWFVGAVVKGPAKKKPAGAPAERISKEEQQQLDRIINKREP